MATKAHAIRVGRPSLFEGICSRILSKISGGRVGHEFKTSRLDPWAIAHWLYDEKRGIYGNSPIIAIAVWTLLVSSGSPRIIADDHPAGIVAVQAAIGRGGRALM